jgi:hypothetical protein
VVLPHLRNRVRPPAVIPVPATLAFGKRWAELRRAKYSETPIARLLSSTSKSVEPFNQWLKNPLQLNDQVWRRGLHSNRTQLLATIFCYPLLLRHNHRRKLKHAKIQRALDRLGIPGQPQFT